LSFKRGDYRPFVRASVSAFDQLQSATAVDLAGAVPYIDIKQVDQFTGEIVGENIMKEVLASPSYSLPIAGMFQERPLVSLGLMEVKTEQQYGYAYNSIITLEFTVHRPDVVFSAEEYSSWRELLVEGNCFTLEYGWTANTAAVKNDLLNGVGFYDQDSGLLVLSRTRMLIAIVKYTSTMDGAGVVKFSLEARTMGNIGLRQVSLLQELAEEFLPQRDTSDAIRAIAASPLSTMKRVLTSMTDRLDDSIIGAIQARLSSLDESRGFNRGPRRFVSLGDVLDSFVAPIIERMCTRLGYLRADLFLGNFNKRAGKTSEDFGAVDLAGRSIADFPVPVKLLRDTLSNMHLKGRLMRVESLVESLITLTKGQAKWSAETRFIPAVFPIANDVDVDGGTVFRYAIADSFDGSDVFDEGSSEIPAESITKQQIFDKLSSRGIPIIEAGRVNSVIKSFTFDISPEPLQRSIFAERQLQARKDRVQMVEQPDPAGLAGRANTSTVVPLGTLQGSVGMVGNFVFQLFSYVWVEFFGAYPISGVYNIRDRVDRIEPGNFTTTLGLISEGIDPFNTRRRLSSSELAAERRIADDKLKRNQGGKKKRK
jgi:hypothetical protein